jgi:redox-sensing transcriptional repressor
VLAVPAGVEVRKVDLATELQILAFHEQRRTAQTDPADVAAPAAAPAADRSRAAG